MSGIRVEMSPESVGFNGYVLGGASLASFKDGMFNEVADTIKFRRFMTGSTPNPDSDSDRTKAGHVFGKNSNAVGKLGRLNVVYH